MARRSKKNTSRGWVEVEKDIRVIGDEKRFSLSFQIGDDITLGFNGLRVQEGKNGDFISSPAWKDKDGNYHNYCFLQLPAELEDKIIDAVFI